MSTAKEELGELIQQQPDDSTGEEIVRELAFHLMIQRGLADSDVEKAWLNEAQQRYREFAEGRVQGVPGHLVFERARGRLG